MNGGVRHLQVFLTTRKKVMKLVFKFKKKKGCYTNIDEFKSEALVGEVLRSSKNFADRNILVGNHDYKVILETEIVILNFKKLNFKIGWILKKLK